MSKNRLNALRALAAACQCLPGSIAALRRIISEPNARAEVAVLPLLSLAGWYAPICRDTNLLNSLLAVFRTVSRRPRRLCEIPAPSATEALLRLAQQIVRSAEQRSKVQIERPAAERRRPTGSHLDCLVARWPLIRSYLQKLRIPNKNKLELYRVEAEWEFGQALRRCEIEQGQSAGAGAVNDTPSKPRGRKRKHDPAKDRKIAEAWERAKEAHVQKKDFVNDWNEQNKKEGKPRLSLSTLNKVLDRLRHAPGKRAQK